MDILENNKIFNVGIYGDGIYKSRINGERTKQYRTWMNMLNRCYGKKERRRNRRYQECIVCDEWHNFQKFAKWHDENYYEINDEKIALNKDILIKNNKIYSPATCVFVPNSINMLFLKTNKIRGEYPIGVSKANKTQNFEVYCSYNGKQDYLGTYSNPIEAFFVCKKSKEKYIKMTAEKYKNLIPKILYDALLKYEVEITD